MAEAKHLPPNTTPWHAVAATRTFAEFAEAMAEHAQKTASERAERERDRAEHTTYAAAEHQQPEGG